ncbi:MAG: ribosome maturation factor RimP [Acidobacteriota bacterium]|nr:MAG: ribosome maturation factor RimP [Acidobacteriota bacterium]
MTTTGSVNDHLLRELEGLARSAASAEGVDVAWCELRGKLGSRVLRVFIERADGDVGLADCERVSKKLSVVLDVEDPIDSAYTLEVSTPGLDRPLHDERDYRRFEGKLARVKTNRAVDGRKRFVGRLAGISEGFLSLDEEDGTARIPLSVIESGRLEVELDPTNAPNRVCSRGRV